MKIHVTGAMVALFYSGVGLAQMPGDKPAAGDSAAVTVAAANERRHAREADARHCLVQKDDRAIIRCADKYRYPASPK